MLRPAVPSLAVLLLVACPPPSSLDPDALTSASPPSSGAEEGSSSSPGSSSSSSGEPGTTAADETEGGSETGDESTTTGEPLPVEPPEIVEAKWTPDPLTKPGMAMLEVTVEHADGIEATYDESPVELVQSMTDADKFTLGVPIHSELLDGTHTAVVRATRGQAKSAPVEAKFVADLPTAGSEGLWEAGKGLGEGLAGKIVRGPKGELYEFGTLKPGGERRCYLRRRTADGMAPVMDVVQLQPGKLCSAIDVVVEPSGDLLLLYKYEDLGSESWQLDRHNPWDQTLFPVLVGAPETSGNAVALGENGEIAVCGSMPGKLADTDMAAWLAGANNPIALDLVYEKPHTVHEVANDCAFVGTTLVFAGEADGKHPDALMDMKRHAVVEFDTSSKEALWIVASGEGVSLRSSAQAVAADDAGGYVTAGHVCGEPCFPQLELRSFAPGGVLMSSFRPGDKTTVPSSVDWHPAGYAIVTAAEIISGFWTNFWVQAWIPGEGKDLWTYRRSDLEGIHWAFDVAIGQTGLIFAVGVADVGGPLVPAFVIVFP